MEAPKRTAWTDPRLDDLGKKVDAGFAKVDERVEKVDKKMDTIAGALRGEMKAGFEKADEKMDAITRDLRGEMKAGFEKADNDIRGLRGEVKAGFDKFDQRFDKLMWRALTCTGAIIAALLVPHPW